jgi:hypothetical protein
MCSVSRSIGSIRQSATPRSIWLPSDRISAAGASCARFLRPQAPTSARHSATCSIGSASLLNNATGDGSRWASNLPTACYLRRYRAERKHVAPRCQDCRESRRRYSAGVAVVQRSRTRPLFIAKRASTAAQTHCARTTSPSPWMVARSPKPRASLLPNSPVRRCDPFATSWSNFLCIRIGAKSPCACRFDRARKLADDRRRVAGI